MAGEQLHVTMTGVAEARQALGQFGEGVQRRQTKIALAAAGGVLKREAVKRAPSDTGTLKRYQIVKTSLNRKKTSAYTVVGAKRRVKVAVTEDKKKGGLKVLARFVTKKDGTVNAEPARFKKAVTAGAQIKYRVPTRYAHLAERKHRFMQKTIAAAQHSAAEAAIRKLRQGVEEERAKAAAKARR